MKSRNPTPSGNAAKSPAPTGGDDTPAAENVAEGSPANEGREQTQMELENQVRPASEIRLRPATRPGGLLSSKFGGGDSDLSSKQHQRTVEELNRRIIALEGTQRERAQELAKEKEIRLKTERQLAAAERALQESATIIESNRAEAKRELDQEIRRRESETGRQGKDQFKQVEELQEELRRTQAELAEARAANGRGSPEPSTGAEAWEARAIAQFEADIDNYRARIKSLIGERDAIAKEKERLAAALATGGAAEKVVADPEIEAELTTLRDENADLQKQLHLLKVDSAQPRDATPAADNAVLTRELEEAILERDLAQEEAEKLLAEIDGLRDLRRQDQERFESERAATQFSKDSGAVSLRKTIDLQQKAVAAITRERDEITRERDALTAEITDAQAQRQEIAAELAELRAAAERQKELAALGADDLVRQHQGSLAQLAKEHEIALAVVTEAHAATQSERATLEGQLQETTQWLRSVEASLATAQRELQEVREKAHSREEEFARATNESDRVLKQLEASHAETVQALERKYDDLQQQAEQAIAKLREDHAKELNAFAQGEDAVIAQKDAEIAALRAEHTSVLDQTARQLGEAERASEQALQALRIQMEQQIADRDRQMSDILGSLAEAREGRQADSAAFSGEFRALVKQRDEALSEIQRMRVQIQQQATELEELKNDTTKSSDELRARAEREIVRLQREREQLIKQRDEFRNRVKQLADQQRRLMEEIANDPFRSISARALPEPTPVFIEPLSSRHQTGSEDNERADRTGEIPEATIMTPTESRTKETERKVNIPLPRARPAAPPPPQVRPS